MPQQNTDRMWVTSILVKYINVYSPQIYTTTHKNKLGSTQIKSYLPHFGQATWRWIICTISIPSPYISLENTIQLTEIFQIIFLFIWSYGCITYHSPGVNRKIWGTRLMLRPCPEHCGFCFSSHCKLDHKDTACRSYRPVLHSQTHNSALLCSLSNSVCGHKWNVLLLRNVTWYSLPVASACNLLNQTYILTENLKSFHQANIQNTSYTCKITKIHFNSQILNTNQMSTSFSLSMPYNTFLKNLVPIKHKISI